MKLLNELISLRRISKDDAEGAAEEDAIRRREDSRYSHDDDLTPRREYGVGFVDDEPDTASEDSEVSDTEGLDDVSDDMGRFDDKQGGDDYQDVSPDNPYEEGTPEHEAWVAGYEAAMQQGGDDQDVDQDADIEIVDGDEMGDELSADELSEEPPVEDEETLRRLARKFIPGIGKHQAKERATDYGYSAWANRTMSQAKGTGPKKRTHVHPDWKQLAKSSRVQFRAAARMRKIAQGKPAFAKVEAEDEEGRGGIKRPYEHDFNNGYDKGYGDAAAGETELIGLEQKSQDYRIGYKAGYKASSKVVRPVEDENEDKGDDVDFYTDKNWRDRYGRHEAPEDERAFSNTALTQGEKAFNQGNPVSSNPYERGTLKSNEWLEGFRCGQQEASQRNASWWTGPGREADEDEESPSSATDQGYEAYVNGKGRDANPFQRGTTDYNDWNEAWADARESTRYDGRPGDEDCEVGTMIGGNKNYGVEDEGENEGEFKSRLYPVRGVKQAIAPDDDWYDTIPHGNIQKFDVPPRGSRLTYQIHAPHDTYRPGAVEAEIYRSPDGKHYYREILTGDNDEQWFYIPNRVLKQLLPYDARRRNQETEDEGENVWGDNAYGQQGAHMGGVKKTDIGEPTPDASSELDPNNDLGDNEAGDELEQALGGEEGDPKLDALTDKTAEDPDRQGLVRKVKGAHLVYKRQIEDGTYEELWIYNSGNLRDELDIRKAVLAGTDIPTSKTTSPDGTQKYELWSAGNAEMLQIKGLPN